MCIFLWSKVVYKARVLSDWTVILSDVTCDILELLKILLVCFKFMLPASEHLQVGFLHHVVEFLVSVELKHDSLDELQSSNNVLVALDVFIFAISSQLVKNNLSALSLKNCKPFSGYIPSFPLCQWVFTLGSRIPFWAIVSTVFPVFNAGSVAADSIGFKILSTEYCTSIPFFWNLIPHI